MSRPRFRNFCFTLNNYNDADEKKLLQFAKEKTSYLVYGREVGEEKKTPHLQGYVELKHQTDIKSINKFLAWHTEKRKGTAAQAADYCKKDGAITEIGTISKPGTRSDLKRLRDLVVEGADDCTLFNECTGPYLRYINGIERARHALLKKKHKSWSPVSVKVYWGGTGTGKTKRAYSEAPDLYRCYDVENLKWWCGYNGEKTILLDDFRPHAKFDTLLRILDGYPMSLQIKGGSTWKCWDTVIITSNHAPEGWYPMSWDESNPLKRRISSIEEIGSEVTITL